MANYQKYLLAVRTALKPLADKDRARFLAGYMRTQLPMFGLSVVQLRQVAKPGFSFMQLPAPTIDEIWHYIYSHAKEYEVLSIALLYYQARKPALTLRHWHMFKRWIKRIDNWEHSDRLSDLLATLHERYPTVVYQQYRQWNRSAHPWEVRQSLVGLFYYAQGREKQPSFSRAMRMIRGAFYHPDVYVQKGVGWSLRECYNVYPSRTHAFLKDRARELSPTAWQAATEKLTRQEKENLKHLRNRV